MDFFQLLSDIEKVDPEVYERFDARRRVFKHFGAMGKKLTAAAMPGLVSGLFSKAYGQATSLPADVVNVLNLALSLEYLEFYFYDTALNRPTYGLPTSATLFTTTPATATSERQGIVLIRNDEEGHIKTLRAALGAAAIPAPDRALFDYSGGAGSLKGPFADVFTSSATFYKVAQSFVDTGVRAYKGGAPTLFNNKDLLETALNIHSVEARHSSHVRTIRRGKAANLDGPPAALAAPGSPATAPKSWISGIDNGGASPGTTVSTTPIYGAGSPATDYPAENNIVQAGRTITNDSGINDVAASEAFDEPLDPKTVRTIARNFVASTSTLFT
ncbi:ferritin-like domain-containing protein [Hymenobacter cavernae]|uniref:Ferritin-like domain-containing protein n=1 Tax=Hymenobacter cavernae TaxID=2044852 RepID=A0ABQ1UGR2_9BACT|nr:ferritin-like domain-containing protein [Hymenobacter cavernae]GGF16410.1 hypothetical protein GCM10011383_29760 [Hymenobacter cavernae]